MPTPSSPQIARSIYRWIAFAAFPGTLWSAMEMYVLTLRGAQMLFFSIIHTMPPLVFVVLVGLVGLFLWGGLSVAALVFIGYRTRLAVSMRALLAFSGLAGLHLTLLFSYDVWSSSDARVAVCLVGIAAMGSLVVLSVRQLGRPVGHPERPLSAGE